MDLIHAVLGVLACAALLLLATWLRSVIRAALERRHVRADMVQLVMRAFWGAAIVAAVLAGFTIVTQQPGLGLTGFLTAAIITSLGLQDLFKNYVAGYYVLLERNIKVGDVVESQGYKGVVTEVKMRVTYLRGEAGELIIVPNLELFNHTMVVLSEPKPPRRQPKLRERTHDDPDQSEPKPPRRRPKLREGPQDDPDHSLESVPL